uniref:Putative secreted protein n=1 Tax=Anopheles darlingi TaxID=43151 RepID=A0A2M4DMN7_ANODA
MLEWSVLKVTPEAVMAVVVVVVALMMTWTSTRTVMQVSFRRPLKRPATPASPMRRMRITTMMMSSVPATCVPICRSGYRLVFQLRSVQRMVCPCWCVVPVAISWMPAIGSAG